MALTISGNIKDTALLDVLEGLKAMRTSGMLVVQSGSMKKSVYVEEGRIVFASSSDSADRLGEVMVKAGKLSRQNLEEAVQISKRLAGFKKFGAILVENKFVSPADLFGGLKLQVKEIITSLLLLEEGTYHFEPNLPPDIIPLQVNLQEIVQELIQRMQKEG